MPGEYQGFSIQLYRCRFHLRQLFELNERLNT